MRGRLRLISLALNVALALACVVLLSAYLAEVKNRIPPERPKRVAGTNRYVPILRRQFFSWSEIESADYEKYVSNLRDIGCPESTIRDIIVADVNQLFRERRAREIPLAADRPWWTNRRDPKSEEAIRKKTRDLSEQRIATLLKLLGTNWNARPLRMSSPENSFAEGPLFKDIPADTRKIIFDKISHVSRLLGGDLESGTNQSVAIQAERDGWRELVGMLTPEQYEEARLRFSHYAQSLRDEFDSAEGFNTQPEEFRRIFTATEEIDFQLRALGDSEDPAILQQRASLEQQRDTAIKNILGQSRYAELAKLQDPAYQAALQQVEQSGGSVQSIDALYKINQATAEEMSRIEANSSLTELQREIELRKAELAQLQAQAQATGQALPEPPPPPTPPATVGTQRHVILPGETLSTLALTHLIRVSDIITVNPGVNLHALKPGDTVNLPVILPNQQ